MKTLREILIVKLSAIGDVLHTLPAATALQRHAPTARITWVVEEAAAPLLDGHPAIHRLLVSRRKSWLQEIRAGRSAPALKELTVLVRALRSVRYDAVLDFHALLKSAFWVALARGDRKIGFGSGMQHMEYSYLFLTERLPAISMEIHALERNLHMLTPLGIHTRDVVYNLPIAPGHNQAVDRLFRAAGLDPRRPFLAVNPMAKWETKLWPASHFVALGQALGAQYPYPLVFTGAPEDRPAVTAITRELSQPVLNLAGRTTLKELAALYRRATLLITTDTGPMHLAAAVDTPVVALFGPTAPWRTGPYGPDHHILRTGTDCSPCFKRHCPNRACMDLLPVSAVLTAVDRILTKRGAT